MVTSAQHMNSTYTFFEARISSSAAIRECPEGGRPLCLFPFVSQENELPSSAELCSGSPSPGSPGSPRSSGSPPSLWRAGRFHIASWSLSQLFELYWLIPQPYLGSSHPQSFSLTLSLTYFFPLLLKRSQIEAHTTDLLAPPPSYPSIHTILVLYLSSTKTMISIIKDFLTFPRKTVVW